MSGITKPAQYVALKSKYSTADFVKPVLVKKAEHDTTNEPTLWSHYHLLFNKPLNQVIFIFEV